MNFKDFIKESQEKHAVLAFGRFQPPTTGHEAVVNKVKSVAKQHNASHHVVLSHSNDPKQNPLSASQKVKHAKRFFPGTNISHSTKDHPNFLKQAEKLHKSGVTHLHMVAGSDRTGEYHKILHKYNGTHKGALFNFKHIKVHSAGQRDPDAPGTAGMSGSKLRSHAASGNYNEFKKGVPKHVPEHHAKELYHDLRKGMNIKEYLDINYEFEQVLNEGVYDKGIFKAVFLAGGPGSGKDYVLANTLDGHGLTEINSDKALEYLMDKTGLDKTMPASEKEKRDVVRGRAKNLTELKQRLALMGRNGLIINGTGDDLEKIQRIKERLDKLGYKSSMIMVNTSNEVSQQRNIERGQKGGRTVPEDIRQEKWQNAQNARPQFAEMFGEKYIEFDNSEDLRKAGPDVVKQKKDEMNNIFKFVADFVGQKPQSDTSKQWVAKELQSKDTTDTLKKVPDGGQQPHPSSRAKEEAGRLGLEYYGFGRYGRDGEVTHRVVHDTLVQVTQDKIEPKMAKKVNEEFESLLEEDDDVEEHYSFSSTNAKTLLTLREDLRKWFSKTEPSGDWKRINSKGEVVGPCAREPGEPKPKCMSAEKRASLTKKERAAAVRAKRKHDPVADRKGKGGKPVNVSNFGKGKISESIDKGTEVGISMAASGENLIRPNTQSNKAKKKPFESFTADAGTESMSAQKVGELKRQGIDLKTFKAKRPIG
jgi:predicted ABC-type ATPase